ncbi:hypothetical protein ACFQH6_12415 [Halobacteriaceae archaeon GCM10025711]
MVLEPPDVAADGGDRTRRVEHPDETGEERDAERHRAAEDREREADAVGERREHVEHVPVPAHERGLLGVRHGVGVSVCEAVVGVDGEGDEATHDRREIRREREHGHDDGDFDDRDEREVRRTVHEHVSCPFALRREPRDESAVRRDRPVSVTRLILWFVCHRLRWIPGWRPTAPRPFPWMFLQPIVI